MNGNMNFNSLVTAMKGFQIFTVKTRRSRLMDGQVSFDKYIFINNIEKWDQ